MLEVCFIAVNEKKTNWSLSTPKHPYAFRYKEDMEILLMQKGVPPELIADLMTRVESDKPLGFGIRS